MTTTWKITKDDASHWHYERTDTPAPEPEAPRQFDPHQRFNDLERIRTLEQAIAARDKTIVELGARLAGTD